ncbi:MAG TPA: SMP-30/gluconolactonase/LRE family protein [Clostridiaceae bacterium]
MEANYIVFSEGVNNIFFKKVELKKIATGYFFTEGPVWDEVQDILFFTNFSDNTIHTWSEEKGTNVYRRNGNRAVGLSMDATGKIVSAETRTRAITYAEETQSKIITDSYEGQRLNSPNDVVVKGDGDIFFTDPYSTAMGDTRELEFNGIFKVTPGGKSILLADNLDRPNGLAFSPDESILYVDDTNYQNITAYHVREDNTLSEIGIFATLDTKYGTGAADGMKVDEQGNVYLAGPGGIWVFDKNGSPVVILQLPEPAGNLCFGGTDHKKLFITATSSVYMLQLKNPGIVPRRTI